MLHYSLKVILILWTYMVRTSLHLYKLHIMLNIVIYENKKRDVFQSNVFYYCNRACFFTTL
jgi:hypothetical protein